MPQHLPSILCQSERGALTVINHGLAYSFTFKNIRLLLAADEIDVFRQSLEAIDEQEWFASPDNAFVLLPIHRMDACVYLTRPEVEEMIGLLLEATVMVKVHQRLVNRV